MWRHVAGILSAHHLHHVLFLQTVSNLKERKSVYKHSDAWTHKIKDVQFSFTLENEFTILHVHVYVYMYDDHTLLHNAHQWL